MRLKRQNIKEWFNSYLTFQHLKANSSRNLVNSDDRDNMWLPIYDEVNAQDKTKIVLFREEEIFKIIPQANFNFILNSKSDHNNARLFKVLLHELKSYYQAHIHSIDIHSGSIPSQLTIFSCFVKEVIKIVKISQEKLSKCTQSVQCSRIDLNI